MPREEATMVNVFYVPNRICMDCGKEFTATVELGTGNPVGCIYWGKHDFNMKYMWGMKFIPSWDERFNKEPLWRRWLHDHIPSHCFEWQEPSVRPIWNRWILDIKRWWYSKPVELWTCHECTAKEEEERKNEVSEGDSGIEGDKC